MVKIVNTTCKTRGECSEKIGLPIFGLSASLLGRLFFRLPLVVCHPLEKNDLHPEGDFLLLPIDLLLQLQRKDIKLKPLNKLNRNNNALQKLK